MGKIISFFSAKGGVGKTSTCVNLAYALANNKSNVLVVDFDVQSGATHHLSMKFNKKYSSSLYEVLSGKCAAKNAIHEYNSKLHIIPNTYKIYKVSPEDFGANLNRAVSEIQKMYTYIFFDLAPSVHSGTTMPLFISDYLIIPVDCQGALSILGLETAEQIISEVVQESRGKIKLDLFGILPCFVDRTKVSKDVIAYLEKKYGEYVLPTIRRNTELAQAASLGKTIFEHRSKSIGAEDYRKLKMAFNERIKRYGNKDIGNKKAAKNNS